VRVAPRAAQRQARSVNRLVVRAEEGGKITKSDRKIANTGIMGTAGVGVSEQSLSYLDGSLPGDFGFDPLGLSDPEGAGAAISPSWLAYAEVIHCRWAMLGAAGAIAPEILGNMGIIPKETGVVWFASGVIPPLGAPEYWTDAYTLFTAELTLMAFAELRRYNDFRKPGSNSKQWFLGLEAVLGGSGNPAYPGGQWFNMANFGSKRPEDMAKLKLNEIKNGRLAMIATLGYAIQAIATGEGPAANLSAHLADPTGANILTTFAKIGGNL